MISALYIFMDAEAHKRDKVMEVAASLAANQLASSLPFVVALKHFSRSRLFWKATRLR
jgi:hypothetical protein